MEHCTENSSNLFLGLNTSLILLQCVDGNNNVFSQLEVRLGVNATATECNAACSTVFYHAESVGFGTRINSSNSCYCYYSGGITPSIIPPQNYYYTQYPHPGNGAIMSTKSRSGWECFVYAKVSNQCFSFQSTKFLIQKPIYSCAFIFIPA